MAEFTREAPNLQPQLTNPRLYDRVRTEAGFAQAATAVAGNVLDGFMGAQDSFSRGRQQGLAAQQAQRQAAIEEVNDKVALGIVDSFGDQLEGNMSRLEATSPTLAEAGRVARGLETARGQGLSSSAARNRAVLAAKQLIVEDPSMASEILERFKSLTGESFTQMANATLDEAQAVEIQEAESAMDYLKRSRETYNLGPEYTSNQVLEYAQKQGNVVRRTQEDKIKYDALVAENNLTTLNQEQLINQRGNALHLAATESFDNLIREIPDVSALSGEEVRQYESRILGAHAAMVQNMATQFDQLGITGSNFDERYPTIRLMRDQALAFVRGETSLNTVQNQLNLSRDQAVRDIYAIPEAAEEIAILSILTDNVPQWLNADQRVDLNTRTAERVLGLTNLIAGEIPSRGDNTTDAPSGAEGGAGQSDRASFIPGTSIRLGFGAPLDTRGAESSRQGWINIARTAATRDALDFAGLMLSDSNPDLQSEPAQLAFTALRNSARQFTARADDIPVDYYRAFADFTATEEGMMALMNANEIDETGEVWDGFFEGYTSYLNRTVSGLARDMGDMLDQSNLSIYTPRGQRADSLAGALEAVILDNGNIAFKPKPEFSNNRTAVNQASKMNRKYGRDLRNLARSHAHLINNNTDYKAAAQQMLQNGRFGLDEDEQTLFELVRAELPDATDEEIRGALNGTGQ